MYSAWYIVHSAVDSANGSSAHSQRSYARPDPSPERVAVQTSGQLGTSMVANKTLRRQCQSIPRAASSLSKPRNGVLVWPRAGSFRRATVQMDSIQYSPPSIHLLGPVHLATPAYAHKPCGAQYAARVVGLYSVLNFSLFFSAFPRRRDGGVGVWASSCCAGAYRWPRPNRLAPAGNSPLRSCGTRGGNRRPGRRGWDA